MNLCKHCKTTFEITPRDYEFYSRLKVSVPTHCPQCRKQRRMAFRNERNLYKRTCDFTKKNIISIYSVDKPYKIYDQEIWWSDKWNPLDYAQEFDFGRPFFDQFYELQLEVPRPPLVNNKAENSAYCNFADMNKNCYLVISSNRNQDTYYSSLMVDNKDCSDCLWCTDSELLYECIDCQHCYNVSYAQNCEHCVDSHFLFNCKNVQNCILCVNLTNKRYFVLNKPVSKEEYDKILYELKHDHSKYGEYVKKLEHLKTISFPIRKASNFISSENVVGNNIFNSKNVYCGFDVFESRDCAYLHDGLKGSDCYDICFFDETELCYESTSLIGYGYCFTNFCRNSYNLWYCDNCHGSKNLFGCIGLRGKEYCIFNKQYSREEFEKVRASITEHMEKTGEFGEFFPVKFSPFAYNETLAASFFPLSKDEVLNNGWMWKDKESAKPIAQTYEGKYEIDLVPDSVVEEILLCGECGWNYRIISQELNFYRKMGLPVPAKCHECRYKNRLSYRTPNKLWKRKCDKCGLDILTAYSDNRPEKIYCEQCYRDYI